MSKRNHTYMKKNYIFSVLFLMLITGTLNAQFGLPMGFNVKEFKKNEETALWILMYDTVTMKVRSFDGIPSDKEVIAVQDKSGWKVVAAELTAEGYQNAMYYNVDNKYNVTALKRKPDTTALAAVSRAMYQANENLKKLNIKVSNWKKAVKINADQTIHVFAFCDGDANGTIWYGPECIWYFPADGKSLSASKIVNKSPMMADKAGNVLNVSCPTDKMPTLGLIWLAHRYKINYATVNVAYKTGSSTYLFNKDQGIYSWEHMAK